MILEVAFCGQYFGFRDFLCLKFEVYLVLLNFCETSSYGVFVLILTVFIGKRNLLIFEEDIVRF